jgi:flagellar biosynthesis protein FlhG
MDQASKLRQLVRQESDRPGRRARVIAVTSGKGGVGKSNLSVSLSLAAASMGRDVVLIDCDLGLANVDVLLDLQVRHNLSHLISGEASLSDVLVPAPGGLRVLPGAAGVSQMADLTDVEQRILLEALDSLVASSELVVLDTGAGISRRVVEFCLASGEVIVVTTPEPTAIADAYAMIKVLGQTDPGIKIWLIVNMANHRGEAEQILERIILLSRRFMGLEVERAGYVLSDPRVPHAVRRRLPFSLAYPSCHAAVCVAEVARTLGFARSREGSGEGFLRRMRAFWSGSDRVATGSPPR